MALNTRILSAGMLVIVLTLLSSIASAQPANVPDGEPYPWEANQPWREPKCKLAHLAAMDFCQPNNWPTFYVAIERLHQLAGLKKYIMLERALGEVSASNKESDGGIAYDDAIFVFFENLVNNEPNGFNATSFGHLAPWKAEVKTSRFRPVFEALYIHNKAWLVRGNGPASSVSAASWQQFDRHVEEARKMLLTVPAGARDAPLWHYVMLKITLDKRSAGNDAGSQFQNAVARWPRYFRFYELILNRLHPRWGGSWEVVARFVDHWDGKLQGSEGKSMYARLYKNLLWNSSQPGLAKLDWTRMKASFDELVARYSHPNFKNSYASYACLFRDKEAYAKAMGSLQKSDLRPDAWLSGHSHEACTLWAAS